jgi:hypothetical protein
VTGCLRGFVSALRSVQLALAGAVRQMAIQRAADLGGAAAQVLVRAMVAAMLLLVLGAPASANGLFVPLAGAQTQEPGQAMVPFLAARRMRDVMLDPAYLAARVAPIGTDQRPDRLAGAPAEGTVRIELFPGVVMDLVRTSISEAFGGGFIWTAQAQGPVPGWADLVIRAGRVTGHVTVLQPQPANFRIDPIGSTGRHRITELDGSAFPPSGHPRSEEPGHGAGHEHGHAHGLWQGPDDMALAPLDDTTQATIDVLIAYTSAAAGRVSDIMAQANLAISLSNTGFSRSNVHIRFRLVGTHLVDGYVERDYIGMLDDLTDGQLSAFRTVHDLRDSTGADLVGMLVASQEWCGYAWILPPSPAMHAYGYSLTTVSCISDHVFAHELGHNMGLDHDRFVLNRSPSDAQYNFGHVSGWEAGRFLTIMAYRNACPSCTRINNFSNPHVTQNGFPTGIPAGTGGAADAARWLNEVRHVFAAFRPTDGRIATTTGLVAPTTASPGALLTFEARVTAQTGTPAGLVQFRRNGEVFAGVSLDATGTGRVSFNSPAFPDGTHQITAHFDGNSQFMPSESSVHILTIAPPSVPPNNLFAHRTDIVGAGRMTGSNLGATSQPGQPTIATPDSNNAVWWSHTPAQDGTLSIDTFGSGFNTTLAVFTGAAVNALSLIAANDDTDGAQSRVSFPVTGGVQYQIAVAGFRNATGNITLNLGFQAATITTLTAPATATLGQSVILSATVTAAQGTPGGAVSFLRDGMPWAEATLNAQGQATVNRMDLPIGRHQITVRYPGSAGFAASSSTARVLQIDPAPHSVTVFVGGGAVFGQTDACNAGFDTAPHAVTIAFVPSELHGPPSSVSIFWRDGSENLVLWGPMVPSSSFLGAAGRQNWSRFVFYPTRPLIRVVQRQITQPLGGTDIASARELALRLRVQNFGAIQGCAVTVMATLTRA